MKLTLQLSCYNGARYLPFLFLSLQRQTLRQWHLIVLDNASTQEESEAIKHAVSIAGFPIELFRVEKNIGFAGAHNFMFEKHKNESDFVALLNDDAILEPIYLESLVNSLEKNKDFASVSGIIYRWDFENQNNTTLGKTNIIDTKGLYVSMNGAISDIDSGVLEDSISKPSRIESVFGVSGCLPCYRVYAIKQTNINETLFDPTFVTYKEDVELAFRLHSLGYSSATIPNAVAYHRRTLGHGIKRDVSDETRYQSYRNHLWTHIIHTSIFELFSSRCLLIPYEILKLIYWLIQKPIMVSELIRETKKEWKNLLHKRQVTRVLRDSTKQRHNQPPKEPEKFDADIVVVMVSHNDLSKMCLESFVTARSNTSLSVKLVVADNQSKKYIANEFVQSIVPDAIVLLRNKDHGYGRSCNRAAKELNARYYFILNPDTVLTDSNIFDKLSSYLNTHKDVGIIAPKIYYLDGRLQETCRRFPKWFVPFVTRTDLQKTTFGKKYMETFAMQDYDHETKRDVDWVQGSALFVEGNLWRLLDGFDDRYWLYFEDTDLCRRVHVLGKKIIYDPQTTIQHAHGKESATYANILINLLKKKEARGHIVSWLKYLWKWK